MATVATFCDTSHRHESVFAVWTKSLLKTLPSSEVVLAVDETKLKGQFGVMVVGLVFEARCIPLAWRVYVANCQAAYPAEGQVTAQGQGYCASGTVFKKRGRIEGHVRVLWGKNAQERWALVTNDPS